MLRRPSVVSFSVLTLALALSGACTLVGSENNPGRAGNPCDRNTDCGYGESCQTGICVPVFCSANADCAVASLKCCGTQCIPTGQNCNAGCINDADCGGGLCALGRCVSACGAGGQCGGGETCVPVLNICVGNITPGDNDLPVEIPEGFDFPDGFDLNEFLENFDGNLDDIIPGDEDRVEAEPEPDGRPELPELPFEWPENAPPRCSNDADCADGACVLGVCADLGGSNGGSCESEVDCSAGRRCLGGVCIGSPPDGPCQSREDCGGGICVPGAGICIGGQSDNGRRCATIADCPANYDCVFGLCLPGVSADQDRTDRNDTTDRTDTTDTADRTDTESGPGDRCQTDADCGGDRCIFGFCVPIPGGDSDGGETVEIEAPPVRCRTDRGCPAGQSCINGVCTPATSPGDADAVDGPTETPVDRPDSPTDTPTERPEAGQPCQSDADCPNSLICVFNTCL